MRGKWGSATACAAAAAAPHLLPCLHQAQLHGMMMKRTIQSRTQHLLLVVLGAVAVGQRDQVLAEGQRPSAPRASTPAVSCSRMNWYFLRSCTQAGHTGVGRCSVGGMAARLLQDDGSTTRLPACAATRGTAKRNKSHTLPSRRTHRPLARQLLVERAGHSPRILTPDALL